MMSDLSPVLFMGVGVILDTDDVLMRQLALLLFCERESRGEVI